MGKHHKVEKVSYDVGIGSFLRLHLIWSQKSDFTGYLILSRTEFQQPGRLQKVITHKQLITVGRMRNFSISFLFNSKSDSGCKGIKT
jgi:hypothetical protein